MAQRPERATEARLDPRPGESPSLRRRIRPALERVAQRRPAEERLHDHGIADEDRSRHLEPHVGARDPRPQPLVYARRPRDRERCSAWHAPCHKALDEATVERRGRREARRARAPLQPQRADEARQEGRGRPRPPVQHVDVAPEEPVPVRRDEEWLQVRRARLQHERVACVCRDEVGPAVARAAREQVGREVAREERVAVQRDVGAERGPAGEALRVADGQRVAVPRLAARLGVEVVEPRQPGASLSTFRRRPASLEPRDRPAHRRLPLRDVRPAPSERIAGGERQVGAPAERDEQRQRDREASGAGRGDLREQEARLPITERDVQPRQREHGDRAVDEQEPRRHVQHGPGKRGALAGDDVGFARSDLPRRRMTRPAVAEREPGTGELQPSGAIAAHRSSRERQTVSAHPARSVDRLGLAERHRPVLEERDDVLRLERSAQHRGDAVGRDRARGVG